jgi:hypothetical protein
MILYQKFNVQNDALELGRVLNENNIEYKLEVGKPGFDPAFVFDAEFRILIHESDFDKANDLFVSNIPEDYYLLTFSDDELLEIITKKDEWNDFDFNLAQKLLKERGKEVKPELVKLLEKQRLDSLKTPEISQKTWIYAGYILGVVSGLLGLFIGLSLMSSKKVLPNGEKVYSYIESDRKHGLYIVIISSIMLFISVGVQLISSIMLNSSYF